MYMSVIPLILHNSAQLVNGVCKAHIMLPSNSKNHNSSYLRHFQQENLIKFN